MTAYGFVFIYLQIKNKNKSDLFWGWWGWHFTHFNLWWKPWLWLWRDEKETCTLKVQG